ncbi:MAG: hypothetical protein HY077_15505 [Elusimicrobia bacterium]|nr:hypothetical protein [Elusimicrobiota bacterium]
MRTTIYLPMALHDDLRRLAYKSRRSMADLLRIAAEAHFAAELIEVRKDSFRDERLENIGIGRRLRERRRLQERLQVLDKSLTVRQGNRDP